MKFKKGQRWKTRDGRKAVILTTKLKGDYPILCVIEGFAHQFRHDGRWNIVPSESDLIEPWPTKRKPREWKGEWKLVHEPLWRNANSSSTITRWAFVPDEQPIRESGRATLREVLEDK